jgi:hypothetical protein
MRKVRPPITILALTLAFAFPALLHAQSVLIINSAQADFSAHTIAISGINFGSTQPTVNLDAMQLAVTAFSPTAIKATLPAGLAPARTISLLPPRPRPRGSVNWT